jgi:hypothetical protein
LVALDDFDRNAPMEDDAAGDAYAASTYEPFLLQLSKWEEPARTRDDAISALRMALKEGEGFYSTPPVTPMIRAALAWLEGPSEIEKLLPDWIAICDESNGDIDEEEYLARYQALQNRIIGIRPSSARDLAIQHYVDTDSGGSGHSDEFEERIERLAKGGANG